VPLFRNFTSDGTVVVNCIPPRPLLV
jgi:hypothetical protein